jgi:uncharacterized membrane protein
MTDRTTVDAAPAAVRWVRGMEEATGIDALVRRLEPAAAWLTASPGRRDLLQGKWLGHALHPLLTDLPIGAYTCASLLDLTGGRESRAAADRLIAVGLLSTPPAVVTGLAEWSETARGSRRVGAVHAISNTAATLTYLASWRARRRDRRAAGIAWALAGTGILSFSGFLGAHLVAARKVSSRHPVFDETSDAAVPGAV